MKRQKANFLDNITWSEYWKNNNTIIQILLSTPHGGFSETNINSTGNKKNKQTNKQTKNTQELSINNY